MMLLLVINGISVTLVLTCMLGYATSQSYGEIRLVGGATPREGRVEIYYDGVWGTVCDDNWDLDDAIVVCRQLGFGQDATAVQGRLGFEGTGQIWMDDVLCTGREDRLEDCLNDGWGIHDCSHFEDASVRCGTGEINVRLVDGDNEYSGRVEIFFNGEWGTVCDDSFDIDEGKVICNQLGYPGDVQVYGNAEFGKGRGPIMEEIDCFDPAGQDWTDCQTGEWYTTICTHGEDVGLSCLDAGLHVEGDARLVNGQSRSEGRVEIFFNSEWGTICDDHFDKNVGDVICRQLGFESALFTHSSAYYSEGDGPIMRYINCDGYEDRWNYCSYEDWATAMCSHSEDASVTCTDIGGESVIGIVVTAVVIILIATCCCSICAVAIRNASSRPRRARNAGPPPQSTTAQPVPTQALKNQTRGTDDPPSYKDVVSGPAFALQNYPQQPYPTQPGAAPYPAQPPVAPYPAQPGAAPYPSQPGAAPYPSQPGAAPYPSQPGAAPYLSQPGAAPYPSQPGAAPYPLQPAIAPYPSQPFNPNYPPATDPAYPPTGTQQELYPQQANPQSVQVNPVIPSAPSLGP